MGESFVRSFRTRQPENVILDPVYGLKNGWMLAAYTGISRYDDENKRIDIMAYGGWSYRLEFNESEEIPLLGDKFIVDVAPESQNLVNFIATVYENGSINRRGIFQNGRAEVAISELDKQRNVRLFLYTQGDIYTHAYVIGMQFQ